MGRHQTLRSMANPDPHADPQLSEAEVQAFADGLLGPERAADVRRYMESRPEEARRIAFYGRLNQQMQNTFRDDEATSAKNPPQSRRPERPERPPRRDLRVLRRIVAGVLAAACVAAGALFVLRVPEASLDNAALMALKTASAGVESHGSMPADVPDLSSLGFHAVLATTVPVGFMRHAAEIVYRNDAGETAVLLSVADPMARGEAQWLARRAGDERLLTWCRRGTRYVLAGRARTHGLMRAADSLSAH